MKTFAVALGVASLIGTAAYAGPITMDWVRVGNAGNAADPDTRLGSVSYEYRIGAYEVTNAQYAAFLNSVIGNDPNTNDHFGLYNQLMGSTPRGGITRESSNGRYIYVVKENMGNKPVNYTSFMDAARFCNWVTNGHDPTRTESGVYTLSGLNSISAITRDMSNPDQVFLPNRDEWYKAAYHQPASQGGDIDDYWPYATRSHVFPTVAYSNSVGDIANPGPDVVNYALGVDWNGRTGNVSTVGSAGSTSYYGAYDMNGNVFELNEPWNLSGFVGITKRGGSWLSGELPLRSTYGVSIHLSNEDSETGFRLASPIPGPGSAAIVAFGVHLLARRRRP